MTDWISVEERLPELLGEYWAPRRISGPVMVKNNTWGAEARSWRIKTQSIEMWHRSTGSEWMEHHEVTHWMPLPLRGDYLGERQ